MWHEFDGLVTVLGVGPFGVLSGGEEDHEGRVFNQGNISVDFYYVYQIFYTILPLSVFQDSRLIRTSRESRVAD